MTAVLGIAAFAATGALLLADSQAAVLEVGPGKLYSRPSDAIRAAKDGDEIEIAAGTYSQDVAAWKKNNLTIRVFFFRQQGSP